MANSGSTHSCKLPTTYTLEHTHGFTAVLVTLVFAPSGYYFR